LASKRIIVIGGGITGLAAAHRLVELSEAAGERWEITLVEASERLGGVIRTVRTDGYLCEAGPENFVTNKPGGLALCRRLGIEDQVLPTNDQFRQALIVRKGRLLPIPEGFLLLAPTKIWPMVVTPLFSPLGKIRMAMDVLIPRRRAAEAQADESLASFIKRRFGREALDRAVQPLIGGIYTADPEMLSLRATMPRFLDMEQESGSVILAMRKAAKAGAHGKGASSGARYSLFVTLRDGLDLLVHRLRERITDQRIRLNGRVTSMTRGESGWAVGLADGTTLEADGVIVTGPAHGAAEIVGSVDDELTAQLRSIQYATTAVVHVGYKRHEVPHKLNAFGFVTPAIENRSVMAGSFSSVKFPGRAPEGCVLIRAFLGGAMSPRVLERDDAGLVQATRDDLRELLGIEAEPHMTLVHRWRNAMPQYRVGHLDLVAKMRERMARHRGLSVVGNAFEGVGIPDCIVAGEAAAKQIVDELAGD